MALALLVAAIVAWPIAGNADSAEYVVVRNSAGASYYTDIGWAVSLTRVCPEGYKAVSGGYRLYDPDDVGVPPVVTVARSDGNVLPDDFPATTGLSDRWQFSFVHGSKFFVARTHVTCITD